MEFIFLFAVLPKICFSTSIFQDFCSDLFCSYLQRNVQMFTNFCFSENLLVTAANRFKVIKIFISVKVTVYIQDRRLWSEKALDFQGKRERERETETETERRRQRQRETERDGEQNLTKQFTLHSVEVYSEPFPTSKQGGYLV